MYLSRYNPEWGDGGRPGSARFVCRISYVRDFLCFIYPDYGYPLRLKKWRKESWVVMYFCSFFFLHLAPFPSQLSSVRSCIYPGTPSLVIKILLPSSVQFDSTYLPRSPAPDSYHLARAFYRELIEQNTESSMNSRPLSSQALSLRVIERRERDLQGVVPQCS